MEKQPAQATLLKEIRQQIDGEKRKASHSISRLNKLMDELDQRNNVFMYVILNGLFFWELRQIMRIEAWKEQYAAELPGWLDAIGQMDALNSLATFAYNHPDYIYPKIVQAERKGKGNLNKEEESNSETEAPINAPSSFRLRAEALGHPLMNRDRCVRNDIDMVKRPFSSSSPVPTWQGKAPICVRWVSITSLPASAPPSVPAKWKYARPGSSLACVPRIH